MKKYVFVLLLMPIICLSQNFKFSGNVVNDMKLPIAFASVCLRSQSDTLIRKVSTTNDKGFFEIEDIVKGSYSLQVRSVGFVTYSEIIAIENEISNKEITLNNLETKLEQVVVSSKQPTLKRKIDRLEFKVENTILSNNNAWEILKKTPGVTISGGNLSIRGSKGILVTINDKNIYLTGEELKTMLEATNGDDIKLVEVITNPPAKYGAEGSAVLNIKMKKGTKEGYKGSVKTAYVQSIYAKYVASTSQYFKIKKLSFLGSYTFGSGTYLRQGEDVVVFNDQQTTWKSVMNRKNKSLSQNTYRLNAEYEVDSLNTVSFGTNGFISQKNSGYYVVPTTIYDNQNQIESSYITSNKRIPASRNSSYNLSFEHKWGAKESLNFSSDYTNYNYDLNQDVHTVFNFLGTPEYTSRFVSDNRQEINLFSSQLDYSLEKDEATFESGLKFGNVKAKNKLLFQEEEGNVLVDKREKSNVFEYNESIFAAYASFSKELKKWSLKAGLRTEYTQLEGVSVNPKGVNTQNYLKVFPTLYAMYKPSEGNEIGVSYGKRITRPNYSWLNPSKSYYNKYSYFIGDVNLQPTITHNFSFLYTLKSKYNFDLYYRNEKNPSMEISFQDNATNMVVYHFTNIEKDQAVGLDFSCNMELKPWWTIALQSGIKYTEDLFQGIDDNLYKNDVWGFNGSVNQQFNLNKKKDFTAEVNFWYNSPSVQGTFTITGSSSLEMSCRKKFWDNKAEVSLILSDIYRGEKSIVATKYADQNNYFYDYSDTQSFRIGFKYNLGNQILKNKPEKEKTEEQKRL
jgi:hypothetical protein